MRAPEVQEYLDTFITEVIDFINVENLKVFTRLGESDQTFGLQIAAIEQVEVRGVSLELPSYTPRTLKET